MRKVYRVSSDSEKIYTGCPQVMGSDKIYSVSSGSEIIYTGCPQAVRKYIQGVLRQVTGSEKIYTGCPQTGRRQ